MRLRSTLLDALSMAAIVAAAPACGRRATLDDCRLIVDKSVELQMKEMRLTDPSEIQKREDQISTELRGELEACEGRRVTRRTIACVRASKTPQDLDQCLR